MRGVLLLEASVSGVDIRFLGGNLWAGSQLGVVFVADRRQGTGERTGIRVPALSVLLPEFIPVVRWHLPYGPFVDAHICWPHRDLGYLDNLMLASYRESIGGGFPMNKESQVL